MTLLNLGGGDAVEVASTLRTDDLHAVTSTLTELERTGYVRPSPLRAGIWEACTPRVAFATALAATSERLRGEVAFLAAAMTHATELALIHDQFTLHHMPVAVESYDGVATILRLLSHLSATATSSVDSLLPHVPTKDALAASVQDDGPLMERGIRLRSVFPLAAGSIDYVNAYACRVRSLGASVRTSALAPARILVVDQTIAVVIVNPQGAEPRALVFRQPAVVDAFMTLFLMLWGQAADLAAESSDGALSPMEHSIICLMMLGSKDDSIARSLGVSSRTVRRAIGGMCERANAESRFALGVEAVRRGWVLR